MSDLLTESPALSPEDERLVRLYAAIGRPSDTLPYSSAFTELVAALREQGDQRTEREIARRLFQLRKAARLPRVGHLMYSPLSVPEIDVELVESLLRQRLGTFGSRDQLPYTEEFDTLLGDYNRAATQPLTKEQFWRLVARVSK